MTFIQPMNKPHPTSRASSSSPAASRGIGAATARLAAERGYAVCVNYRERADAADDVVATIERAGGRAVAVRADVSVEADVMRMFEACDTRLGTLTALVNNAGIVAPQSEARIDRRRADAAHDGHQRHRIAAVRARGREADVDGARRPRRRDRQSVVDRGAARIAERIRRLRGVEGRDRVVHRRPGARGRR